LLELEGGRALQWFICILHANELPLHLLQKVDGITQGPKAISGPIGTAIQTCEQMPVVSYTPIALENFPDMTCHHGADFSTDQMYLYEISQVVSAGDCTSDLANRKPGPVIHSR
jgi:hypothetical protein